MNRIAIAGVLAAWVGVAGLAAGDVAARPGEVIRVEHHDPRTAPSRGPALAPVTIEIFVAPSNQTRASTFRVLEQLQTEHPTRVRLVYRILWRNENKWSALGALEANAEGKFDAFLKGLAELKSTPKDKDIIDLARQLDMDPERMKHALGVRAGSAGLRDVADSYADVLLQVLDDNNARYNRMIPHTAPPAALINSRVIPINSLTTQQANEAYEHAYASAQELLDRGVALDKLAQAFDREALGESTRREIHVLPDAQDPNPSVDGGVTGHPLADPPIDLRGMPSYGSDKAPHQIVVLCSPTSSNCRAAMDAARATQHVFPKDIRITWVPFFDVGTDDAAALGQLGDAALCAEKIGTVSDDDNNRDDSPGWHWVEEVRREVTRSRAANPKPSAETLIDRVAAKLRIDSKALASCRASLAGATFDRVAAARHAGVKLSPTVVIGGRIYNAGIKDQGQWQTLVEAELGPGALSASVCAEPSQSGRDPSLDDRDCSLFRLLMFVGASGK